MADDKKPRSNKPIKSWFLTFPQSGEVTLQQFLDCFSVFPLQFYKIVKELHEDGNPHLHCIIQFKGKRTFNAMKGRIQSVFPFDWKRIHMRPLGSKESADIYMSKDAKDKLEGGSYEAKAKRVIPTPSWISECKEEEVTQEDRDIQDVRLRQAEAEYENSMRFTRHMLIKGELDYVYPVWARQLQFTYGTVHRCREKIVKKK